MQQQKYENILNEQIQPSLCMNNRAKMTFLQDQKERLQIQIFQLIQNNELLRKINKQISKNSTASTQAIVVMLAKENQTLQKSYIRISKENLYLSSSLLMNQQIFDQHVLQHQTITKDYEQKIVELRRAIQIKQANIQQLQKRIKSDDTIAAPPTNVTLLFFNEIDQLKKTIENLTGKNKFLEQENRSLKHKVQKFQMKLQLIQSLTTKSKLTYEEFKHFYSFDNQPRKNSAPKKDTCIPLRFQLQPFNKKLNEGQSCVQTRESTQYTSRIDLPIKMLIYKQVLQIQDMKKHCRSIQNKLKVEQQLRQKLASSNSSLNKKLTFLVAEINYYKNATQDFMQLLSSKGCRTRSAQKLSRQQFLQHINTPAQITYLTERKKYWLDMQQNIKIDRFKLLHVKNKYKKMKRSFSCFRDYHSGQIDHIEKYLNKKPRISAGRSKMQQPPVQTQGDFSLFIDKLGYADISIIQTSQKQKPKVSYSQWKKTSKSRNMLNLTILQENIL